MNELINICSIAVTFTLQSDIGSLARCRHKRSGQFHRRIRLVGLQLILNSSCQDIFANCMNPSWDDKFEEGYFFSCMNALHKADWDGFGVHEQDRELTSTPLQQRF